MPWVPPGRSWPLTGLLPLSSVAMDVGIIITSQTPSCIRSKSWLPFWTLPSLRTSSVTWACKCQHEGEEGETWRKSKFKGVLYPAPLYSGPWSPSGTLKPLVRLNVDFVQLYSYFSFPKQQLFEAVFEFFKEFLGTHEHTLHKCKLNVHPDIVFFMVNLGELLLGTCHP